MANRVELSGIVMSIDSRETKHGTPYDVVYVDDQEHRDPVPIALFGYESPVVGQEIYVDGILEDRNGYTSVSVRRVDGLARRQQQACIPGMRQPPPEVQRPEVRFAGKETATRVHVGDELPF